MPDVAVEILAQRRTHQLWPRLVPFYADSTGISGLDKQDDFQRDDSGIETGIG